MPDFSVTPEALRTAATSLSGEGRALDDVLAALDQRVQALQANWDGAARDAYAAAHREWSASLDDMRSILGRIATSTEEMADGYVTDDKHSATRFTHQA